MEFPCWPPSVNNITTVVRNRKIKTKRGRDFEAYICAEIAEARLHMDIPRFTGPVAVVIKMHPATRRKYDLDNMPKGIQDSLTAAGIWDDDEQIALLTLKKCKKRPGGSFTVSIRELPPDFGEEDE